MKSRTVSRSHVSIVFCVAGFRSRKERNNESKQGEFRSTSKISAIGFSADLYDAIVEGARFID